MKNDAARDVRSLLQKLKKDCTLNLRIEVVSGGLTIAADKYLTRLLLKRQEAAGLGITT
jgi:hypothetical protein